VGRDECEVALRAGTVVVGIAAEGSATVIGRKVIDQYVFGGIERNFHNFFYS